MTLSTQRTVVLIGPVCVGKTTIGALLAERLDRRFIDIDDIAEPYYELAGQPMSALFDRFETVGPLAAFRWWEPALALVADRIVRDHVGAVIAFGAGHSHFRKSTYFEQVQTAIADVAAAVVLLNEDTDDDRSITELRRRSLAERDSDWMLDGTDVIASWVRSTQNKTLADHEFTTRGLSPSECADGIARLLG